MLLEPERRAGEVVGEGIRLCGRRQQGERQGDGQGDTGDQSQDDDRRPRGVDEGGPDRGERGPGSRAGGRDGHCRRAADHACEPPGGQRAEPGESEPADAQEPHRDDPCPQRQLDEGPRADGAPDADGCRRRCSDGDERPEHGTTLARAAGAHSVECVIC